MGTCVWASGAATAAPGGRASRLLDLKAKEEETTLVSQNEPKSWTSMNFQEFSKNHDFRRKIKVAKSVRIRFWAIQGMRTRLETISRHPECVLLAPHAASRAG